MQRINPISNNSKSNKRKHEEKSIDEMKRTLEIWECLRYMLNLLIL